MVNAPLAPLFVEAIAQINAVFDIKFERAQHAGPALAISIGRLLRRPVMPPAAFGNADLGAAILQRFKAHRYRGLVRSALLWQAICRGPMQHNLFVLLDLDYMHR